MTRLLRTYCLAIIVLFLSAATLPAQEQEEVLRFQKAFARLDEFIAQHMREANVPGMAVALTSRTGLLRVSTYGFADITARSPVTPETLFEIGSISKSFTCIALLQQREAGKFDPHAPLTRYLPWFHVNSKFPAPITAHYLMSHTAGIPRDRDDIPTSRYQAAALRERETAFPPGAHFVYSNVGYQVLGYLVEELTGQTYADYIRTQILDPLGMTATQPVITHETRKRLAVGYERFYDDRPSHPSQPLVPATWFEYGAGDGSIATTPAELAAYLRMLLNRGQSLTGRIVSEESFNLMTQRVIKAGEDAFYGYGLRLSESDGHTIISHGGGMVGYQAMLVGDLDAGLGAVVFINGPGNSGRVAEFALKVLRAALYNQDLPSLPPTESPTRVENAADYAGTYTAGEKTITLVAEGTRLLLVHNGERIALERRGKDRFYVHHPDFNLFLLRFGRKGEAVVEAFHGPDWYVNARYAGPTNFDYPKEWQAYPGHYRTAHPWFSNFRIVLRKGALWLIHPEGGEQAVVPLGEGVFRVGNEDYSPERLRFDTIINDQALRANLSGCNYYRTLTR